MIDLADYGVVVGNGQGPDDGVQEVLTWTGLQIQGGTAIARFVGTLDIEGEYQLL